MKNSNHGRTVRRSSVPHSKRPELRGEIHVVLRIRRGLPNLRTPRTYRALERAFRAAKDKDGFGLVHYSVQQDHLHLLVWAVDKQKLARAMQGFAIRVAKALNRQWKRRVGNVFAERYFARAIEKFTELRRVVRYILQNGRKHGVWTEKYRPDPFSSARWFKWHGKILDIRRPLRSPPVSRHGFTSYLNVIKMRGLEIDDLPGPRHYPIEELDLAALAS
jgi:REP-associated tyrosine transposase